MLRAQYLQTMGITSWYCRVRPAHGVVLDWPVASAPASAPEQQHTSQTQASTEVHQAPKAEQTTNAAALLDSAAQQDAVAPAETGKQGAPAIIEPGQEEDGVGVASEGTVQTGQGVEFKQRWWTHDGWLIVDTRPVAMPAEQQRQADRLLAALAQTLCGERKPTLAYRIDWPLFVNRSIKHDAEEARFYLQQKWQAVQQQSPVHRVLMLGEQTPELLGLAPVDSDKSIWQQDSISCCSGPASNEMLHLPAEKRRFWKVLRTWLADSE